MIDLDEIERLARAATPGKWSVRETVINGIRYGGHWVETDHEDLIQITGSGGARSFTHRVFDRQIHDDNEANATFVVGVQPATILALVARLRAAEAALHPFAWAAEDLDDNESGELWERPAAMSVECRHLRAAAAHFAAYRALTEEPTP